MRYGKLFEFVRRSAGALLLLGGVELILKSPTLAADMDCAVPVPAPAPACQPQCSDEIYKRAGERLAQQLEQMNQCQSGGPAACAAPGDGCAPGSACNSGQHCMLGSIFGNGCGGDQPLGDPWKLSKENGFDFGGWFEMGYQSKPDGAFTGNGPFLDDNEHKSFNLNQLYLYVTKVADGNHQRGWDWGFRADMIYGVDGNEAQSFGNVKSGYWDFANGLDHGIYEIGIPQLYGEWAMGSFSVKLGHFWTPTGYDLYTAPDNFFFSRQLTWYNGEPFTHSGALATYKVNDKLTVSGGWVAGWDTGFQSYNDGSLGLFGAAYTISDKTTLSYFGAYGQAGWRGEGALNGIILSHKWTDKLMTVHQFDVFQTDNASDPVAVGGDFATDGVAGDDVAMVNNVYYDLTAKWRLGGRLEWYKADGTSYNALCYGVNYKPDANWVIRPEVRHLWAPGVNDGGAAPGTIAANVSDVYGNSTIFGVDAIFKF